MTKLNDTQLVILSAAAQREDGAVILPEDLTDKAAEKVLSALIRKKLIEAVPSAGKLPVWRESEDGQHLSLKITDKGLQTLGIEPQPGEADAEAPPADIEGEPEPDPAASGATAPSAPRAGSKQALLIDLLLQPEGATIEALRSATGWLPHTVRAALSGLRKRGYTVSAQRTDGATTYRASAPTAASGGSAE